MHQKSNSRANNAEIISFLRKIYYTFQTKRNKLNVNNGNIMVYGLLIISVSSYKTIRIDFLVELITFFNTYLENWTGVVAPGDLYSLVDILILI